MQHSPGEVCLPGASFTGAYIAYVKQTHLRQQEGHSYALDPATASLGFMGHLTAVGWYAQLQLAQLATFQQVQNGD